MKGMSCSEFIKVHLTHSDPRVSKLLWNEDQKCGVVFHLLPYLAVGKIGFTAIGETSTHAKALFQSVVCIIDDIAEARTAKEHQY